MKTMTCRQLGGPCDHPHNGETADDVINGKSHRAISIVNAVRIAIARRLHPDQATACSRNADRAQAIARMRQWNHTRRHRTRCAAG